MTKFGYPAKVGQKENNYGCISSPRIVITGPTCTVTKDTKSETKFRRQEREKRVPLKGWDADSTADDGIVGWSKRQTSLEAKRGTKKQPAVLEADYYFAITHRCPDIEEQELFTREASLHRSFHPKPKKTNNSESQTCNVKLRLTTNSKVGVITPAGYQEREDDADDSFIGIHTYRDSKVTSRLTNLDEKRCQSVQDIHKSSQLERSNTHLRIKRLLKFSKKDRKLRKSDEEEDEGYSSKTSSAEHHQTGTESDGEDSGSAEEKLDKMRMYNSMVDLSQLPSRAKELGIGISDVKGAGDGLGTSRGRFSYTHQPTILQLPNPDIALTHDRVRIEKRFDIDDPNSAYAKLKRSKDINKFYKPETVNQPPAESSTTVYNLDVFKPVTLVLRKISIQNAEQNITSVYRTDPIVNDLDTNRRHNSSRPGSRAGSRPGSRAGSRPGSRTGSRPGSRTGSAMSRSGSSLSAHAGSNRSRSGSRAGSALSMAGSPRIKSPHSRPGSRNAAVALNLSARPHPSPSPVEIKLCAKPKQAKVRDVRVVDGKLDSNRSKPSEAMWSPHYSFIDKQTTNYCISDLLPAVDKNIYSNHNSAKRTFVNTDEDRVRDDIAATGERVDLSKDPPIDDGFLLLKKGMDILTGGNEKPKPKNQHSAKHLQKPTLGPPPFRPNQTRQSLPKTPKAHKRRESTGRSSPVPSHIKPTSKPTSSRPRVSSEKGPRPNPVDEDKETQKKLKEAFTQFYRNRPQPIGKEFRRMQTMWNAS